MNNGNNNKLAATEEGDEGFDDHFNGSDPDDGKKFARCMRATIPLKVMVAELRIS